LPICRVPLPPFADSRRERHGGPPSSPMFPQLRRERRHVPPIHVLLLDLLPRHATILEPHGEGEAAPSIPLNDEAVLDQARVILPPPLALGIRLPLRLPKYHWHHFTEVQQVALPGRLLTDVLAPVREALTEHVLE